MQNAREMAAQYVQHRQSSESNEPTEPVGLPTTHQMAELWTRMARMYGHRWLSAYGETDDGTWRAGLRGITGAQLASGLRACADSADAWPPTLPAFRRLCRGAAVDRSDGAGVAARMPAWRRLPEPPEAVERRKRQGREWFAQARRMGLIR